MLGALVEASLRNRAIVLMGSALLIAAGILALTRLPIDAVPDITNVQVQIITRAPALSPLEVEQYVTFPVERGLGGIPKLAEVRSISRYGLSVVTAVFDDGTDIYFARSQINERLREISEAIPGNAERPELGPLSTGLGEIYQFALRGEGHSLMELESLIDWNIMTQLRMVPGVVELNSFGGQDKQYEVKLDPRKLAAMKLGLSDVVEALKRSNANAGGGYIERNREAILIRSEGLITTLDDVRKVVVSSSGGAPITVGALGTVAFAPRLRSGAATMDGEGEVAVGVAMMRMGENSRVVTERVKERLAEVQKTLPEGVTIVPYYDRSELVDRTLHTATRNLAEGAILVVLVLLLLLGQLRAGLIVATSIPLAMLAAILGMWLSGSSGNLMSLGALDFGLIVDGAVIIIENASRRLTERHRALDRALTRGERDATISAATLEVQSASVFGVAIIAIVYVPVLLLSGVEGKLFRPMAATVLFALAGAFLLSLTLVPVLASLFLRPEAEHESPVLRAARWIFEPVLERVRRHPLIVIATALALLLAAGLGFGRLGAEFVPTLDEGSLLIEARRLPGTALSTSVDTDLRLERALLAAIPEVKHVVSRIGAPEVASDPMGLEQSDVYITLAPRSSWRKGLLKSDLARQVGEVIESETPEIGYGISQPIQMRENELIAGFRSEVAVSFYGDDLAELQRIGERAAKLLEGVAGAREVKAEQVAGQRYLTLHPDRVRLARYGLSIDDVNALTASLAVGYEVGPIYEGQRRFALVVRQALDPGDDLAAIAALRLKTRSGELVPLGDVAELKLEDGPAQVSREQGSRRFTVELNVSGRDTVGFVAEARALLERELKLPPGYRAEWGGQYQHYQAARNRLLIVVPLALALILFLLVMAFGELGPALIIFLNVPFAITGGVAALALRGLPFSISAGVGFIALFGVAVLNGLVLLSVAHRHEAEGLSSVDAAFLAARERLRPVLMTALVAVLGFVPMALSTAPGSEVQRPLATVVIGGLLSSTLLTLLVLPTVYGRVRSWVRGASQPR